MRLRRRVLRSYAFDLARAWVIGTDLFYYPPHPGWSGARDEILGRGQATLSLQLRPELQWLPDVRNPRVHEAAASLIRRLNRWIDRGCIREAWITRCVVELMIVPQPVAGRGPGLIIAACSIRDDRGRVWSAAYRIGPLGKETL